MKAVFRVNDEAPYEKNNLVHHYHSHNQCVIEYFRDRPDDLLVINIEEENPARRILDFLGMAYRGQQMPHLNKSTPQAAIAV